MRFTKMHGLGNDYVYVDCFAEKVAEPAKTAIAISDRHRGVGADGLILIGPSDKADVRMRMFNADGSEAEMCGNGIRCVAKFSYEHNLATGHGEFTVPGQPSCPESLRIETGRGVLTVGLVLNERGQAVEVCVNMGEPILPARQVPVAVEGEKVVDWPVEFLGARMKMTCVSMGNPHAVFFCEDVEAVELERIGPVIEKDRLFPKRVNVHFVQVISREEFRMRTWERGSGVTMACGTGACSCCVAGVLTGKTERVVTGNLPGGKLRLNWCEEDNCVYMTGPATEVFEGVWPQK